MDFVLSCKNRSLEELARTMLNENSLPKYSCADAVNTACYVLNKVLIRPILKKTPYEIFKRRRPVLSHLKVFGCKCSILNNAKKVLKNLMQKRMKVFFNPFKTNMFPQKMKLF